MTTKQYTPVSGTVAELEPQHLKSASVLNFMRENM